MPTFKKEEEGRKKKKTITTNKNTERSHTSNLTTHWKVLELKKKKNITPENRQQEINTGLKSIREKQANKQKAIQRFN